MNIKSLLPIFFFFQITLYAQNKIYLFDSNENNSILITKNISDKIENLKIKPGIVNSEYRILNNNFNYKINQEGIINIFSLKLEFKIIEDYGSDVVGNHNYLADIASGGYAVFTVSETSTTANIHAGEKTYLIEPLEKDIHFISELEMTGSDCNADKAIISKDNSRYSGEASEILSAANIKVLVVYTLAAAQESGDISGVISSAITETNNAFYRSMVQTRVELAGTAQVTYNESGDYDTDLDRLIGKTDGYMDNVHSLRTQYQADICVLLVSSLNENGAVRYIPADYYFKAFCVVRVSKAASYYSMAHEIGHLLGARHDNDQSNIPFQFGHGFTWNGKLNNIERWYMTIMATDGDKCQRVPYFSNPYVHDQDANPMGTVSDNYVANAIDIHASTVAAFEPRVVTISGPTSLNSGQNGTWTAAVVGGTPPYNYQWSYYYPCDDMLDGDIILSPPCGFWNNTAINNYQITRYDYYDFMLRCIVTDATSTSLTSNILYVDITGSLNKEQVDNKEIPLKYFLEQNHPNPFNPSTTINYSVKKDGLVTLKVYDVLGNEIAELVNEIKPAGFYSLDYYADNLTSGIYFYSITTKDFHSAKKMILAK